MLYEVITMIAGASPHDLRGTAYGFFNLVSGVAMLLASTLAGLLWAQFGARFTFTVGGLLGITALLGILWRRQA